MNAAGRDAQPTGMFGNRGMFNRPMGMFPNRRFTLGPNPMGEPSMAQRAALNMRSPQQMAALNRVRTPVQPQMPMNMHWIETMMQALQNPNRIGLRPNVSSGYTYTPEPTYTPKPTIQQREANKRALMP